MLSYQDVQEILRIPLVGIIPESEQVLAASNQGNPAIHFKGTDVAQAYEDVVSRFLGEEVELRFTNYEKPGLSSAFLGRSDMALLSFLFPPSRRRRPPPGTPADHHRPRTQRPRWSTDFLPALHKELIAVISKYTKVNTPTTSRSRWTARATWRYSTSTWCCRTPKVFSGLTVSNSCATAARHSMLVADLAEHVADDRRHRHPGERHEARHLLGGNLDTTALEQLEDQFARTPASPPAYHPCPPPHGRPSA